MPSETSKQADTQLVLKVRRFYSNVGAETEITIWPSDLKAGDVIVEVVR